MKTITYASATILTATCLTVGCGRLGDLDDKSFGEAGDVDDDSLAQEKPGSGGPISESCMDGVLDPGEWCQVQEPEDLDAGIDPCSLSVADFDDDGRPDLAVPNSDFLLPPSGNFVANVLRGHGNGDFAQTQPWSAGGYLPVGLAVGDFDGDGRTDIATANHETQSAYVLRNTGSGVAFEAPVGVGVDSTASSVASGDLDGDGIDDMIVNTPSGIALLRGAPTGVTWFDTIEVGSGTSMHAELADIDEDGKLDMVAAVADVFGGTDRVMVFHGAGDGSFSEWVEYPLAGDPWWITVGDLNMDDDLDLAVAEYETDQVSLLLGNARGGFSPRTSIDVCDGPQSVSIGDMNNDGANDFVVGCMDADTVQMWLQTTDGAFELVRWWSTGARPVSVQTADLNLDGQLDIAWANQYGNSVGLVMSRI